MILYHGSTWTIPQPDSKHSQSYLDLGSSFHSTTFQEQAGKYGIQYLDYHVLANDLLENESELFST